LALGMSSFSALPPAQVFVDSKHFGRSVSNLLSLRPIAMINGDFDFIIIGSGAGGGTLAYRLAPSGKKILLIERGPFVRREKENWNSLEVNALGRYNTKGDCH
jgi:NAD(P)-binding Rossmann-like domain